MSASEQRYSDLLSALEELMEELARSGPEGVSRVLAKMSEMGKNGPPRETTAYGNLANP